MAFSIDNSDGFIRVTYNGSLTDEDIRGVVKYALSSSEMDAANRIEDMRNLHTIHVGYKELAAFTKEVQNIKLPRIVKSAILTGNPLQFGIARMFQTIIEHPQMRIEIFSDEIEARSWLSTAD